MSKDIRRILWFFVVTFIHTLAFCQNEIDYSNSGLSTSLCNIFNVSPAVKIAGYEHYPVSGGVSFNGSRLVLKTQYSQYSSNNLGTAYAIKYPFSANSNYSIKVQASGVDGSGQNVSFPDISVYLFSQLPDPNKTDPVSCGGVARTKWINVQSGNFIGSFNTNQDATYTLPTYVPQAAGNY